jgi:hypothetical protein
MVVGNLKKPVENFAFAVSSASGIPGDTSCAISSATRCQENNPQSLPPTANILEELLKCSTSLLKAQH